MTQRPTRIVIDAHAKINLTLRVMGRRPDGFHELRTVLQALELHDTLTFVARAGPLALRCSANEVPSDRENLVWRAAETLWTAGGNAGSPRDVEISIDKRIPVKAGLGGGSSDAAAALRGLTRLWRVRIDECDLRALAGKVGSDAPFFLTGGTALGLGRGDEVYRLAPLPRHWVVIVVPSFGISTADAYAWHDENLETPASVAAQRAPRPSRAETLARAPFPCGTVCNDLEPAVVRRFPEIGRIKAALRSTGAVTAAMSGSGSAVFGLFKTRRSAVAALPALASEGWRSIVTRTRG